MRFARVTSGNAKLPILFEALRAAAERGDRCPLNVALAAMLGCSTNSIGTYMRALESDGLIRIRKHGSSRRAIQIVATGKATAGWDTMFDPPPRLFAVREEYTPPPISLRVPCPYCNCRLDADPALCCPRGRELRKVAA